MSDMRITYILICLILFGVVRPDLSMAQVSVGADLSFLPQLESLGAVYTEDELDRNCLDLFDEHGWQIIRLRLWHSPHEYYRWNGLDSTLVFAQRIKAAGFQLMLDFHYSDWWADPGQQNKPAAWQGLDFEALVDSVNQYSAAVMQRFIDADAAPDYVQAGNEISPGFLFPEGKVGWPGSEWDTEQQWSQLTTLLTAACEGIRQPFAEDTEPEILLHIADGVNNSFSRWWFDHIEDANVPYDVIAFSYYPWWHGFSLDDLNTNLTDMINRYDKPVMIVESNYPFTLDWNDNTHNFIGLESQLIPGFPATPEGQLDFFQTVVGIVNDLPEPGGLGFLLWEPEFIAFEGGLGSPMENLAVFDFDGEVLPSIDLPMTLSVEEIFPLSPENLPSSQYNGLIYPNPANAEAILILPATGSGMVELKIVNLLGQTLYHESLLLAANEQHLISLPIASLGSGKYWVQTTSSGYSSVATITVLR
jgi:arabinogalactan endo-1,4-beta-galactosidase